MEWFFDGLGTSMVSLLFSFLLGTGVGGFAGYRIGIRKSGIRQKQKAGRNSKQNQVGIFGDNPVKDDLNISANKIKQYQKAGDLSDQEQIGEVNHEK